MRALTFVLLFSLVAALAGCSGSGDKAAPTTGTPLPRADDGTKSQLRDVHLSEPEGLAIGADGTMYILDWVTCDVTTIAAGHATTRPGDDTCGFPAKAPPTDIAVDSKNTLYLNSGCGVLVVRGSSTTTLPGSEGCSSGAGSNRFLGITTDGHDNIYYVSANAPCGVVRKYDGRVTTNVAGGRCGQGGISGPALEVAVDPGGIALDSADNLYITDESTCTIRKVTAGIMTTIAGTGECLSNPLDGDALKVGLHYPSGIAIGGQGEIYVAEGSQIRVLRGGVISTFAGGKAGYGGDRGPATEAAIFAAFDIALDKDGSLYFVEFLNCVVRRIREGIMDTVVGKACDNSAANPLPTIEPTPPLTGPCSEAVLTLANELTPRRTYHDGESLGITVNYEASGCKSIRAAFWGHHIAGSPRYQYYCAQCIRPSYSGQLDSALTKLSADSGSVTLIAEPGPFPPTGLDSIPNLEGFQVCTLHVTVEDGRDGGNEISRDFDVDCGDRGD